MAKKILLTGGTGLVGSMLTSILLEQGYEVVHLSRSKRGDEKAKTYLWDIHKGYIEEGALLHCDYIIHLAGAGVFDKPWTEAYKKEILYSRVAAIDLLLKEMQKGNHTLSAFISASAIGIYGSDTGEEIIDESSDISQEYLAQVVVKWEAAADKFKQYSERVVKLRTGIVLAKQAGALEKMVAPIRLFAGAALGSGSQYISWIHVQDLCRMYLQAIENAEMLGVYNAAAPVPVTNKELISQAAKILNKPLLLPNVPAFMLKLILGKERAMLVLGGNKISAKKILNTGFQFKYPTIKEALSDLLL